MPHDSRRSVQFYFDRYSSDITGGQILTLPKLPLATLIKGLRIIRSLSLSVTFRLLNYTQNLESSDTALLVFGNGDGGGGPLAKMLENVGLSVFHFDS